jgi:hypothetical protein
MSNAKLLLFLLSGVALIFLTFGYVAYEMIGCHDGQVLRNAFNFPVCVRTK